MRTAPQPLRSDMTSALPSIFVVGFPKTGSTTLHQRFVDAGAVSATVKEPSVLLLDDAKVGDVASAYQRYYPATVSGPLIDATPYYIYDVRAIERIEALGTATHVVVSVREPWSRLRSQYLDQFTQGYERRSLEHALLDELAQPVEVTQRSSRELSRSYIESTCYGPYVERLLAGPLGDRTRLVAAETLDDPGTVASLAQWTGLDLAASSDRANQARETTSAMPALVHGTASRVGAVLPGWLHRRLGPIMKPVMARLAKLPLPNRRTPELEVTPATAARVDARFRASAAQLRAIDGDVWAGPAPSWLVD